MEKPTNLLLLFTALSLQPQSICSYECELKWRGTSPYCDKINNRLTVTLYTFLLQMWCQTK